MYCSKNRELNHSCFDARNLELFFKIKENGEKSLCFSFSYKTLNRFGFASCGYYSFNESPNFKKSEFWLLTLLVI